ncbi:MAG: helix-turn-helix domain-containing protein [Bacilli bacterium]
MTQWKEFGTALARWRERSGYKSQRKLALAAGISAATLSRIESGSQRPLPETLRELAKCLLGISYTELLRAAGYIDEVTSTADEQESGKVLFRFDTSGLTKKEIEQAKAELNGYFAHVKKNMLETRPENIQE